MEKIPATYGCSKDQMKQKGYFNFHDLKLNNKNSVS